jgi:hypothetical protein
MDIHGERHCCETCSFCRPGRTRFLKWRVFLCAIRPPRERGLRLAAYPRVRKDWWCSLFEMK